MSKPFTKSVVWLDFETTGLDKDHDEILEVAFVMTDTKFNIESKLTFPIKMTDFGMKRVQDNDVVREMHEKSGLLPAVYEAKYDIDQADIIISNWLRKVHPFYEHGNYTFSGSGNAVFDMRLMEKFLPKTFEWGTYYVWDVGIFRRMSIAFNSGEPIIDTPKESYKDGFKVHRALDDAMAHLQEAIEYLKFFQRYRAYWVDKPPF